MKTVIAGSRTVTDPEVLAQAIIDSGFTITEVVSGRAKGADMLGERWAIANSIPICMFPAEWDSYGKSAGHVRNQQMAEYADQAIIVWDGKSRGTLSMMQKMQGQGKPYFLHTIGT